MTFTSVIKVPTADVAIAAVAYFETSGFYNL
jgi:hypothetical protein